MSALPPDSVTPECVVPASRARVRTLIIGTVLFAVLANAVLFGLVRAYPTNGGHWVIRSKWLLLDRAQAVDTLVLGDSTCNQGVRPDVWRKEVGESLLNLCTIGDMLVVNDAWMLEEYLRHHPKPRRVVVIHTFDTWERDSDSRFALLLGAVPRSFGFWRGYHVNVDLDLGAEALAAAGRWFPLYSDEVSLRMWLTHPRKTFHRHEGFQMTDEGYMPDPVARPESVLTDLRLQKTALERAWKPSSANEAGLRALAALAREHDLDIDIVPGPLFVDLYQDPRMQTRIRNIQQWIQNIVAGTPVRVIAGAPPTFQAAEMTNTDHITDEAAAVYTRWVADTVRSAR